MRRQLLLERRWVLPLVVFGGALLVGVVWASQQQAAVSPTPTPGPEGFLARGYAELESQRTAGATVETSVWDLLGAMLVPTLIVLVAAYATIRVLRALNRRVAASSSRTQLLELVDTLSLAGSGVVHIVRLGERYLLVGAGSGGLSLLTELRPEEIELLKRQPGSSLGQAIVPPFRHVLQSRLPRSWRVLETPIGSASAAQPAEVPSQRFGHVPEGPSAREQHTV